jgi:hypothetical protein
MSGGPERVPPVARDASGVVFPSEPLNQQQASQMTGYLGTAMVIASSAAGVNLIRRKQCVEGVSAMTVGLLGTLLMFGGLSAPNERTGDATTNAYSLAAQFIAILFIGLALVRILTIVRNCPGYSVESVAKGMKCQSPSLKMEQGIGEFITGVVFLCALYIFAQNETVAGAVSAHINALRDGLVARFGGKPKTPEKVPGTKIGEGEKAKAVPDLYFEDTRESPEKDESLFRKGPADPKLGGKRRNQRGGYPAGGAPAADEPADSDRPGWIAKLQGNWLLLSAAVLLLIVMAIGFGTNSRVGWITSTVLAVLILIVLSVVYVLSKAEASSEEGLKGKLGAAVEAFKQAGAFLGEYAAGVFALILTLSGMGLVVSGAGAFNQGCAQQTAG